MIEKPLEFINVADLRIGHFVYVDLGWMSHPFPVNSFKIHNAEQIAILRSLGVEQLRFSSEKSDFRATPAPDDVEVITPVNPDVQVREMRRQLLDEQQASLQHCERRFGDAAKSFRKIADVVHAQPEVARDASQEVVNGILESLMTQEESCIRLLSEKMGERGALHGINVLVLSLLLGKSLGFSAAALSELGMGALLHDIGKIDLPDRLRHVSEFSNSSEQKLFQEHVAYGVALARKMAVTAMVRQVIAQHHEFADGSGYPERLSNESISPAARIVALVNQYDRLCNPGNPVHALTPHEALAQIYAQSRKKFDVAVLGAFIRMMGVYPPGSLVQLSDDRYAIVASVNASRPLKPRLVVFDEAIPKTEALVFELASQPSLSIRRSLRPTQLTPAAMEYLAPRERVCYFFEQARDGDLEGQGA